MSTGGYQIINLENRDFDEGVGQVFNGIYDQIEATRKPILITGFQHTGTEYHDFFTTVGIDGSDFIMYMLFKIDGDSAQVYEIRISDIDVVTVTTKYLMLV